MSYFNTDECCMECLDDEREAPGYERAKEMELSEVQKGNMSYPGIGLSSEAAEFLARRRADREATHDRRRA